MIGRDPIFKGFFRGPIDEVRISKNARYLKDFKPQGRHQPDKFTMALYHFEPGKDKTLHDASGDGHDGTIHGATWVQEKNATLNVQPREP